MQGSHIDIMDNVREVVDHITKSNDTVKKHLKEECQNLLNNNNLLEGIEAALPYGSNSDSTEKIEKIIQNIANL